ncbi:MAG: response regulator [Silicimonas sp.]|jgi:DNA-binding response OmpR family regulator|nr:response regulator [Silicimonas sp.]
MAKETTLEGRTALLVEDELFLADKISSQLVALGFKDVFTATTVEEALQHIENEQIGLALLDVNLSNEETTIELGWSLSGDQVPVVFYSGMNAGEMKKKARGHEFIVKPLSLPRLKAAIHRAVLRAPTRKPDAAQKKMTGHEARQ